MNAIARCGALTKTSILTALVLCPFITISIGLKQTECDETTRIVVAGIILLTMYALMILDLVNRTMAALIGAVMAVAAHDSLIGFVSMEDIVRWEDLETLSLLFGMMVIVNILGTSGVFNFLAIWMYKKSNGRFWLLIVIMSIFTGLLSALIDNVSTMLLMAPTLLKLSELEHIDPRYVLMIMVVFSNIGGCATPVGDPPNLIIIGDSLSGDLGITFVSFVAYCAPGVIISMSVILIYLKLRFKSKEKFRLKSYLGASHSDEVSTNLEAVLSGGDQYQLDSSCRSHVMDGLHLLTTFRDQLNVSSATKKIHFSPYLTEQINEEMAIMELAIKNIDKSRSTLEADDAASSVRRSSRLDEAEIDLLIKTNGIKSKSILVQSGIVLGSAVLLFFLQSFIKTPLTLGWISLFAALILLVASSGTKAADGLEEEEDGFEKVVNKIEWSTLMFFFALFIVMEAMAKLGLIAFIGDVITSLIDVIPEGKSREIGAITVILWASGLVSAAIDNVPFTSMMVKVLGSLAMRINKPDAEENISIKPLVFALAFGACFGGNGTLIGASANLVTAGVSAKHGYPISFNSFCKFAAPLTIISLVVINIYLVLVFVILGL